MPAVAVDVKFGSEIVRNLSTEGWIVRETRRTGKTVTHIHVRVGTKVHFSLISNKIVH